MNEFDAEAVDYEPWREYDNDDDEEDRSAKIIRDEVGRRLEADEKFHCRRWCFTLYRVEDAGYCCIVDYGGEQPQPRTFPGDQTFGWVVDRAVELMKYARDCKLGQAAEEPSLEYRVWL